MEYLNAFLEAYAGTVNWTLKSITFQVPFYMNYFWGLTLLSVIVWVLEISFPWRKTQRIIREDFWLDTFYMYANFFAFSFFLSGFFRVAEIIFSKFGVTIESLAVIELGALPVWIQLLIFFILLDFVQWFTHVLLHRIPVLWEFHKVHHSVREMGFAAHLRYHWMENVLYKPGKTLAIMLLGGFEPATAFVVHFFAITIGHLNHSNLKITWGPLKYILNNPVMHLYHHAYELPKGQNTGVNFGISLSIWDYIFQTHYVPKVDGSIRLGFPGIETFPENFIGQNLYGFSKGKKQPIKSLKKPVPPM